MKKASGSQHRPSVPSHSPKLAWDAFSGRDTIMLGVVLELMSVQGKKAQKMEINK